MDKIVLLFVLSLISGILFIMAGFYFLSKKYLEKMNEFSAKTKVDYKKANEKKCKIYGYSSIAIGAITAVWGIFVKLIPESVYMLALVYMIVLVIAFSVIIFSSK